MSELTRAEGTPQSNIVCKFCAHNKQSHRGMYLGQPGTACVEIESDDEGTWLCDCFEWVYGVNVLEIPIDDDELDADEYEQEVDGPHVDEMGNHHDHGLDDVDHSHE